MRARVVLPDPDSPTIPSACPRRDLEVHPVERDVPTAAVRPAHDERATQVADAHLRRCSTAGGSGTRSRTSRLGTAASSRRVYSCCGSPSTSRGRPGLDDPARRHDVHPVGAVGDHPDVVADQQHAEAEPLPQAVDAGRAPAPAPRRRARWSARRRRAAAGDRASASAMTTRWLSPPDSSCGNACSVLCTSSMPTSRSRSAARSRASRAAGARRAAPRSPASTIRSRGLSDGVGFWNTTPEVVGQVAARGALGQVEDRPAAHLDVAAAAPRCPRAAGRRPRAR